MRVAIIGCGGQGREIGRMLLDAGYQLAGYVDDSPSGQNLERVAQQGARFLGGRSSLASGPSTHYIVGIAAGSPREMLVELAQGYGLEPFSFVHPDATIGSDCVIEEGSVIWPGARLSTNVRIGRHVHVNQNVTIGHDTAVDDFATINPSAAVSGNVRIGRRALVGAACVVLQERTVHADATIGAGACVTRDVPQRVTAMGVPARW